jgi:hypothetical protein
MSNTASQQSERFHLLGTRRFFLQKRFFIFDSSTLDNLISQRSFVADSSSRYASTVFKALLGLNPDFCVAILGT